MKNLISMVAVCVCLVLAGCSSTDSTATTSPGAVSDAPIACTADGADCSATSCSSGKASCCGTCGGDKAACSSGKASCCGTCGGDKAACSVGAASCATGSCSAPKAACGPDCTKPCCAK